MNKDTKNEAYAHAVEEYPRESCGLVVAVGRKERYVRCRNVAEDPLNDFIIHDEDWRNTEDLGQITCIVHSHPDASASPSDSDRVQCENHELPWFIIAVHSDIAFPDAPPQVVADCLFEPSGFQLPYRGRNYVFGQQDCYELIRDYYRRELNIELEHIERQDKFWERGEELYLDNFKRLGFIEIPQPSQPGDLVLMSIRSELGVVNHGAIWLGEQDHILHHPYEKLSEKTVLAGYWLENTRLYIRKVS